MLSNYKNLVFFSNIHISTSTKSQAKLSENNICKSSFPFGNYDLVKLYYSHSNLPHILLVNIVLQSLFLEAEWLPFQMLHCKKWRDGG